MKRAGKYLLALFISALLLLTALRLTFLVQIPFYLTTGWIYFLIKTVPQVTLDLPAIGLAVLALLLLVFGVQRAGLAAIKLRHERIEQNSRHRDLACSLDTDVRFRPAAVVYGQYPSVRPGILLPSRGSHRWPFADDHAGRSRGRVPIMG